MISVVSGQQVRLNYTDGSSEAYDYLTIDADKIAVDFYINHTEYIIGDIGVCYIIGIGQAGLNAYATINDTVTAIAINPPVTTTPDSCSYVSIPSANIYNHTRIGAKCSGCSPKNLYFFTDISNPDNTSWLYQTAIWTQITTRDYGIIINYTIEVPKFNDTISPILTLIEPENNTINNTFPLNITFAISDDTSSNVTCVLTNNTYIFDDKTFNTGTNYLTLQYNNISELYQEFPNLNLSCYDNTNPFNNSATMLLNYTIDKILPVITVYSPSDKSRFNKYTVSQININADCYDNNIYKFNITIKNLTNDVVATYESYDDVDGLITIDEILSISNLAQTNYTITHFCADQHTKKAIPDYIIRKSKDNDINSIKWTTPTGNEFELKCRYDNGISSYGSYKSDDNSKYIFYFELNETGNSEKEIECELENKKFPVTYLPNSPYPAHFIMENNWIDFVLDDLNAEYEVSLNKNNNYEIKIMTTLNELVFNSVGELNTQTVITEIEIYEVIPREDEYVLGTCPVETLPKALLFMFFIALSFVIIGMGYALKNGLIGTLGSILLMGLGVYMWYCLAFVSIITMLLALVFLSFFIFRGISGFR